MTEGETIAPRGDVVEVRLEADRVVNFRAWFYPVIAMLLVLVVLGRRSDGAWGQAPQLALLLVYMSLACTFFPLPTTFAIVWAASPYGLGVHPLALATLCTVGTCVANLHDYYVVTFLYRYRPVRRVRRTRLYAKAAAWFERAPLATLTAASFLPIPIDFVRLLAISQGYSRRKFTLATALGRWPRYFALAYFTDRLNLGWQWVLAVGGATVVLGLWSGLPRVARAVRGFATKGERT